MKEKIKNLLKAIDEAEYCSRFIRDDAYWIEEAKKVGFIPDEKPLVHYEITLWRIEISVYRSDSTQGARVFINGEWFKSPFPLNYPSIYDFKKQELK